MTQLLTESLTRSNPPKVHQLLAAYLVRGWQLHSKDSMAEGMALQGFVEYAAGNQARWLCINHQQLPMRHLGSVPHPLLQQLPVRV
jgi:hypothetical protein